MNHDRVFAKARLLGLALQLERGEFDDVLGDGDAAVAGRWATAIAERCRKMAAAIESPGS
jgi:hypothetical protein